MYTEEANIRYNDEINKHIKDQNMGCICPNTISGFILFQTDFINSACTNSHLQYFSSLVQYIRIIFNDTSTHTVLTQ